MNQIQILENTPQRSKNNPQRTEKYTFVVSGGKRVCRKVGFSFLGGTLFAEKYGFHNLWNMCVQKTTFWECVQNTLCRKVHVVWHDLTTHFGKVGMQNFFQRRSPKQVPCQSILLKCTDEAYTSMVHTRSALCQNMPLAGTWPSQGRHSAPPDPRAPQPLPPVSTPGTPTTPGAHQMRWYRRLAAAEDRASGEWVKETCKYIKENKYNV